MSSVAFARFKEFSLPNDFTEGLSSLCNISSNEYHAVGDRGYLVKLRLDLDKSNGNLNKCQQLSVARTKAKVNDIEAVCLSGDKKRIFVSDDSGKRVYEIDSNGNILRDFKPLAEVLKTAKPNLGPEAMEYYCKDGEEFLYVTTELPRTDDRGSLTLFKYSITKDKIVASYRYKHDYALVDLLVDPKDGSLLALERDIAFKPTLTIWKGLNLISIKVFRIRLNENGAVAKKLLFEANTCKVNYEGMAWAPELSDGKRRVFLISDKALTLKPVRIQWPGCLAILEL